MAVEWLTDGGQPLKAPAWLAGGKDRWDRAPQSAAERTLHAAWKHDFGRYASRRLSDFGPEPGAIRGELEKDFRRRWLKDRGAANAWLRDVHQILKGAPPLVRRLYDLNDIERAARKLAKACERYTTSAQLDTYTLAEGLPRVPGDAAKPGPRLARATDWQFWRRVLRGEVARWRDQLMRRAGYVHKRRQLYCADAIVRWQRQRQAANLELLTRLWAESDAGDVVNLADIYRASLANPALRRSELLARIRGFERLAESEGHSALFITITAPSKYHARHHRSGEENPKWNGATPRDTQQYLCGVWARIRAAAARAKRTMYGFRIVEPHHDGCPHWHLLLFHPADHRAGLEDLIRAHAIAEDTAELRGDPDKRVKFERIDPDKGSATGYVIKYVSKAIDGHGVGEPGANKDDLYGGTAEAAADRITAWARTWGIRQFQQIGGPAVGVWREYRRIQPEQANTVVPPHHAVWHVASVEGRWDEFCRLQGGATPGRHQISQIERAPLVDPETGEMRRYRSRYGDTLPPCTRPVVGVVRIGMTLPTRNKRWTITSPAHSEPNGARVLPGSYLSTLTTASPSRNGESSSIVSGQPSAAGYITCPDSCCPVCCAPDRGPLWRSQSAPVSDSDCTASPAAIRCERAVTPAETAYLPSAARAVRETLTATITAAGARVAGMKQGTVMQWPECIDIPPTLPGEPPHANWRVQPRDGEAGAAWTRVNNCTSGPLGSKHDVGSLVTTTPTDAPSHHHVAFGIGPKYGAGALTLHTVQHVFQGPFGASIGEGDTSIISPSRSVNLRRIVAKEDRFPIDLQY